MQPPLTKLLSESKFNFWVMRLNTPLQLMDDRYCSANDHCTRIFPKRGLLLLTEDMLKDLKGTAITLQWIRHRFNSGSNTSTPWHLMLPPRIIEWLERRLNDERCSKDHGL
jgi:chromo domain-containing protein 1